MSAIAPLAALVLLLPFEPMAPVARGLGFELSHLELAALVLLNAAAFALLTRRGASLRLPLAALLLLAAYLLSTAFAEGSALLPLKFTLRVAAGIVALVLTASALSIEPRFDRLFLAFAAAGGAAALVALLEASAFPMMEAVLAPFREHAFEVGGRARVAATFSYPNIAAGFLALALFPAMSFLAREESPRGARAVSFLVALSVFATILLTYSRGALLGAGAAALLYLWMLRDRAASARRLLWLIGSFAAVTIGFVVAEPSFRWRASSEGDRSWYLAEIAPASETLALASGELVETPVRVKNAGKLRWSSKGARPFHLSYRWFRLDDRQELEPIAIEGERTVLEAPLAPGEEVELGATVRAPRRPGTYLLVWDMVHEQTTWFSEKVGLGEPVNVVVGRGPSPVLPAPRELRATVAEKSWRPGRRELWDLALGMFVERPFFGVGPDNFRWRYGAEAGRAAWDTRVSSNSLYLELLATVGLVGFAAFGVLVAKTLVGLLRRGTLEAATLAASIAAFLVHGTVDYLLAFTPIYLAFFVLVGASWAEIERGAS